MRFVDPLPPSTPSLEEQADALRKGLGRAMQWGLAGKLEDRPLLEACLHDQRHDMQIEDSRGTWLWKIVQAVRGEQRFREPLLEELKRLPDERSEYQLCELAYFYAAMGDADFRQRLYEIVEENPVSDSAGLGEEEILRLDGGKGLLFAAGIRGQRLENREWDWDDGQLIHIAIEQLGEDQVLNLLKNSNDRRVQRFYEISLDQKNRKSDVQPQQKHKEKMQAISVRDIIAEAERKSLANFWFRGWGMHASDEDLNTVLEALWEAKHPMVLVNYLRIFSGRAMPTFHTRMIELCNHADEQVRHWAFKALQMNQHPLVREFAVTNLSRGLRDRFYGGLFIRNFMAGDEGPILDALEFPDDVNELHWLLMDIVKVLEKNEEADPSKLAVVVYAHTPCEKCRCDAVRVLHSHRVVPGWLSSECQYDSCEESRNLFLENTHESSNGTA